MNTIQTLEFIKYFTLIDCSWGFEPNSSGIYDYVTEETEFVMPEKSTVNGKEEYLKFIIRQWRINMDMQFVPKEKSSNFCDNYWCFDLTNKEFFTSPNPDNNIKEINKKKITSNGKQFLRYLFYSKKYYSIMKSNPNWHMLMVNNYENVLKINEKGETYYPYSMIITIPVESEHNFEYFLKIKLGEVNYDSNGVRTVEDNTWRKHFYLALDKAIRGKTTNFEDIIKYSPEVIVDELCSNNNTDNYSLNDLKLLIKTLASSWNGVFISINDDDKKNLIIGILERIDKEYAGKIYDLFFQSDTLYFKKFIDLLDDNGKIRFTFLLIRLFFRKMTSQDFTAYQETVKNLPKEDILPFIHEEISDGLFSDVKRGPYYDYEISNYGFLVEKMAFWVYKDEIDGVPQGVFRNRLATPKENVFNYVTRKLYNFDEIIGAVCCFNKPEVGFMQFMVYPIPAFAFPVFDEGLSKNYTITDIINDIGTAAGIIFPFFKIVQAEAILSNAIGMALTITGNVLTKTQLEESIKRDPTGRGRNFLYIYHAINTFWGGLGFYNAYQENKLKALVDFENLLTAWGLYQETDGYKDLVKNPVDGFNEFVSDMDKIKTQYNNYK